MWHTASAFIALGSWFRSGARHCRERHHDSECGELRPSSSLRRAVADPWLRVHLEPTVLRQMAGRERPGDPRRRARPQRGQKLDVACSRSWPHQHALERENPRDTLWGVVWLPVVVLVMAMPSLLS
jgi:hypothetical protein